MTLEQLSDFPALREGAPGRVAERRVPDRKAMLDPLPSDPSEAWRLARQLRDEWRRERYARLKPE